MDYRIRRRDLVRSGIATIPITLAGCLGDDEAADDEGPGDTADDDHGGDHADDEEPADQSDDQDDNAELPGSEGLVYAFAPETIVVIDPDQGEIITTVADDLGDRNWGDARLTRNGSKLFTVEGSLGQVAVIETASRELVDWVDIGPGPTHAFQAVDDEIWAHSDAEGAFYVIDIDNHEVVAVVESGLENQGHGKMVHHDDLFPFAYATNTNDPVGIPINLQEYERDDVIKFGDGPGTHYVEYAPQTGLIYFEWFGGETPVVDSETHEIVDRLDVTGGLKVRPDGEVLGMWDDDDIHFFDITTAESEHLGTVDLDGRGPDDIQYFEQDRQWFAFAANTTSPDVSIIDMEDMAAVEHLPAGAIDQDATHLHRSGDSGDGYYVTAAEIEGTVTVIDMANRQVLHEIEVAEGVDTVRYISE